MTIKVSKAKLIAAIQAKRVEIIAEHAKQVKDSHGDFAKYKQTVLQKTQDFLANVKAAKEAKDITKHFEYSHSLKFPSAPRESEEAKTQRFDRALAQLALAVDDVITLNENKDADFLSLI